jgi:simple sugar transport system substrate-binding protein
MSDHDTLEELEQHALSRRDLMVKGGLLAAGATLLGGPTAAAFGATQATKIKIAVVTHGDTGSFWSVFKKGVDQAAKDLKSRGVSVTQVYANNDVAKQAAGIDAAVAAKAQVIATSVPSASALKGALTKASNKGIEIITCNSGLATSMTSLGYMVHVPAPRTSRAGAGKQFKAAGAKKVLIVIHEAANSGLVQRANGARKILGGGGVQILTIPNAKSDIPGTKTKVAAAFKANKSLDAFLGLDPDVTIPCLDVIPKGTKAGTFDVGGSIKEIQKGRMLFAIDQQRTPRYLPVVWMLDNELDTVNERPFWLDPIIQGERGTYCRAREARHPLDEPTGGWLRCHPPAAPSSHPTRARRRTPDEHRGTLRYERRARRRGRRRQATPDASGHRRVPRCDRFRFSYFARVAGSAIRDLGELDRPGSAVRIVAGRC